VLVRPGSERSRVGTPRGKARHGVGVPPIMNHGGRRKGAGRKATRRADGRRKFNQHGARETFAGSRPRVVHAVHGADVLGVEVCVDLGGADRGVAEELLHDAQVGAALQHVGRERVPEAVW